MFNVATGKKKKKFETNFNAYVCWRVMIGHVVYLLIINYI